MSVSALEYATEEEVSMGSPLSSTFFASFCGGGVRCVQTVKPGKAIVLLIAWIGARVTRMVVVLHVAAYGGTDASVG